MSLSSLIRPMWGGAACRALLIVACGPRDLALAVDEVLSTDQVVTRSLPSWTQAPAWIAGATIPESGRPYLLIDPAALPETWDAPPATDAARRLPTVLVVDDSLTTRMLEQSILESAGYPVELATSAEEALALARRRAYDLFVVDVEMPGMNGFEFVRATRADAALGRVPAILVSSRSSDEDLRRGKEAGAAAYIVKGEFDQNVLLRTIELLTGGRR